MAASKRLVIENRMPGRYDLLVGPIRDRKAVGDLGKGSLGLDSKAVGELGKGSLGLDSKAVGELGKGSLGLDSKAVGKLGEGSLGLDKYELSVVMRGEEPPTPIEGFKEAGLADAVLRNVARRGFEIPTQLQCCTIPVVFAGRDLLACTRTGSGKMAAFCLPVVSRLVAAAEAQGEASGDMEAYDRTLRPSALVLAPTGELVAQINEEAQGFSYRTGLRVGLLHGGVPFYNQLHDLERGVDLLISTPERLAEMVQRSWVSLEAIKYLILYETDRMLDMGCERHIRKIVDGMGMPGSSVRQTMLFCATFLPEIQDLASDLLSNYIDVTVGRVLSSTDQITQRVELVSKWKKGRYLQDILQKQYDSLAKRELQQPLTLIFVETKLKAEWLSYWLCNKGFPATTVHGDRTQQEKDNELKSFKIGLTPILVAIDPAFCDLDIQNIAHVINYDLPKSIESYIRRIARAGKGGLVTSFFTEAEANLSLAKELEKVMIEAKQDVPHWLVTYAQMSPRYLDSGAPVNTKERQLEEENIYFGYLVEKFINAVADDVRAMPLYDDSDNEASPEH